MDGKRRGLDDVWVVSDHERPAWVYMMVNTAPVPQSFQFTTPLEAAQQDRCGKVMFSDMHVSSNSTSAPVPNNCSPSPMTPQEKALAFTMFDMETCVGPIL